MRRSRGGLELELHTPLFFPNNLSNFPFFSLSEEPFLSLSLREAILAGATGYSSAIFTLTTPQQCNPRPQEEISQSALVKGHRRSSPVPRDLNSPIRRRLHSRASFSLPYTAVVYETHKLAPERSMHPNKHPAIFVPQKHVTVT